MATHPLQSYLYEALAAEHGVWLRTTSPHSLKMALYRARDLAADASLSTLQIRTAPDSPQDTLWVVKSEVP